jgi:hypothetical protein
VPRARIFAVRNIVMCIENNSTVDKRLTTLDGTTDMTTGETTSHPTKQPEDGCQVVGYSHLTDETASHATRLSKDNNQVAGYNPANDAGQVIGYSHSTRLSKDDSQVAGYRRANNTRQVHPQGVHRGCKGLITKSGNLLLNKLSAKLTQPQQHTQAGFGRAPV